MIQIVDLYVFTLASTAVLALVVAFGAWKQRKTARAWSVVALMLGVTIWCGAEAAIWSSQPLPQQAFWLKLTYVGVSVVTVAFIVFALEIAEYDEWHTPRRIALISLPQVLTCLMALTNPWGLFYAGYTPQRIGLHIHYIAQNGPLFWVYIVVAYGTMLVGLLVIFHAHYMSETANRTQTRIVLLAAILPFAVSVTNQFSSTQIEGIESTAFFATGAIFLYALVRGQLMHPSGHIVTVQDLLEVERREHTLKATNRELGDELEASKDRADRLYDQATHDALTNLSNRRALEEDLVREVARSRRTGAPLSFLMFDLDDFKPVNDTYSHLAGDAALRMVSEILLRGSRQEDIMCRWGGDEFLVVMPGADADGACRRAEELRHEIESTLIRYDGAEFSITATIGVSVFPEHGDTSESAILAADRALLVAKEAGGNLSAVASGASPRICNSNR